jgi:hypothetical protein
MDIKYILALTNNQIDDLKCCGNCEFVDYDSYCTNGSGFQTKPYSICDKWKFDKLSKQKRMEKAIS